MKSKKIIASLLVFAMMICLMPVNTFAANSLKLTITPSVTEAHPGDEITYTVKMSAVQRLAYLKFKLVIPEGLTFIEGKEVAGLSATLSGGKTCTAEFTAKTKVFIAGSGCNYSSDSDTVLMTFKCSVNSDCSGNKEVSMIVDEDDVFETGKDESGYNIKIPIDYTNTGSNVNITIPATGISLDKTNLTLEVGEKQKLTATVDPTNSTDTLTWESSDKTKATVEQDGTINAIAEGNTVITVKTSSGKSAICNVTVVKPVCKHLNKTTVAAEEATCTVDGNNEYKVCDNCGKVFKADGTTETTIEAETKPALKHDFSIPKHNDTQHWNECSRCGASDTKINHVKDGEYLQDNTNHWKVCGCGVKVDEAPHSASEPQRENVVPATCTVKGSYDEVIYCTVCNYKMSATPKTEPAKGHTAGTPVKENIEKATCTKDGKHDEVVYCQVCNDEISRTGKTDKATGHTEAAPVKENIVAATCTVKGSYDEVVYCSVCGDEMLRTQKEIPTIPHDGSKSDWSSDENSHWKECGCGIKVDVAGHTAGAPVKENIVAATCTKDGKHDEVVYCSVCKEELSRAVKTDKATGHTAGAPVSENEVKPTCIKDGKHDEVVYCSVCKEEMSIEEKTDKATGHTAGAPVKENEVEATVDKEGSYDEVVYCSVCKEELSRTNKTTPKFVYEILEGANSTYQEETEGSITIRANGKFEKFEGIKIDNKTIDKKYYTAKSGSTIVTLNSDYLNTLTIGEHKITFVYDDGEVETTFKIAEKNNTNASNSPSTPKTADLSNMTLWVAGLTISGILFVVILGCKVKGTRKRNRH